jgi:Holliday junction DNA helicase RuvB
MIVNPSNQNKLSHSTPKTKRGVLSKEEEILDQTLRPKKWEDFVGQNKIKRNIQVMLQAAQEREEAIDHLLFCGGPGLGKSTLSRLVAQESGGDIKITAGPSIQRPGDLAAILTSLSDKDILFIDEIHRLNKICEELIYPAMEDFKLNIITGTGPMARILEIKLPHFTLIGATTRIGLLSSPLRNRFGATFQVDLYKKEDIQQIIRKSAKILETDIEKTAVDIISECSRFTPRLANRLLKRVRDFAQVERKEIIDKKIVQLALKELEIDELGLEPQDRKLLEIIIEKFHGGPVGLQALAAAASEEQDNILEVYEPYLLQLGLIARTPKGRAATLKAYQHLKKLSSKNQKLFGE